jgi:hypothetical protein
MMLSVTLPANDPPHRNWARRFELWARPSVQP